jgi:recyclin-1
MASTKRNAESGANLNRNSLMASLKATQIIAQQPQKAVLPAGSSMKPMAVCLKANQKSSWVEILALIVDYLDVPDLFRFARTNKRMLEMVYDDSRWVQKLQSMGVWNETEARKRADSVMKKASVTHRGSKPGVVAAPDVNASSNGTSSTPGRPHSGSVTLFDAVEEVAKTDPKAVHARKQSSIDPGFDSPTLISGGNAIPQGNAMNKDPGLALLALSRVRSMRGYARQEYGKVYGALAPFYYDIAKAKSHTDPMLFRTYRDPEQQAQMLSQLKAFSKSDYASGWSSREQKLESMMGIFENAVLREFDQGLQIGDIDGGARRYARVLVLLNGGMAGIDMFIQNNPVMTKREEFGDAWNVLRGVPSGDINLQASDEFFRRLAIALNEQVDVMDRVFPPGVDVLSPFVERVVEDIVSEYLTTLLDEAHSHGIETYVKAASGVFEQSRRFLISLKPSKSSQSDFQQKTQRAIAGCFEQHIDLYLQEELSFFKTKSEHQVESWEKRLTDEEQSTESFFLSNVNRQAVKQDFLSSFKKVVMLPVTAVSSSISSSSSRKPTTSITATADANKRSSTPVPPGTPVPEAPSSELAAKAAIMNSRLEGIKTLFSIEVALNLVHAAKASLERVAHFVQLGGQSGEEAREQCETIFITLIQILGNRHIKNGFDKAVTHLSDYNPREIGEHTSSGVAPLVTFLELVNVGDLIQQMIDVFYVQELVTPKLSDSDDFLSPAVKEKKRFEQMLDERVAAGLSMGIDVLMNEVEFICATKQQPEDFNPPVGPDGHAVITDIGESTTAREVVKVVSSHVSMLIGSTDKNVLDVFNQEVGVRLFTVLCKHLKRQRISVDGAIRLIRSVFLCLVLDRLKV